MKYLAIALFVVTSAFAQHPPGQHVTVNGAKLWVESEGSGEPVVLIPGGPGAAHYFHPWFTALASTNRVIYFDAFGRGKSDRAKSLDEYTFARDVEDLEGLRKALGLEQWNVLGHSYGGLVAQAYALKYPQRVKRLVLANTLFSAEMWQANNDSCNHELRNQFPEVWAKLEEVRARGFRSSAKEHQAAYQLPFALVYFYDASNAVKMGVPDVNVDLYYQMVGEDGDFIIGGDMAKLDFRRDLATLKMPVLVMAGRYDRVVLPRFTVQFQRYAPQAEFVMFEKSGHAPFIEETAATMETLRKFLQK